VELQGRLKEITQHGLGLIAISYDPVETLRTFADSRGITFPLVSDQGSAIIKRYGLLNDTVDPKNRAFGVPHPGTFIVDRKGVVTSRFFEDAYQERNTAASILVKGGLRATGATVSTRTAHLNLNASVSDATVAPGERVTVVLDITPERGIHVYAPGTHSYQVVRLVFDSQTWLRVHATQYAPSEIYHFKPLNERVEVYSRPFRLTNDLTILATPDVQKMLSAQESITIAGALEYQACDDKICFNPSRVPLTFSLKLKPLDRNPPGE
jgi:AhpC/TSA family/Thiol:disulfide interchange protein DsbD, N-terminal